LLVLLVLSAGAPHWSFVRLEVPWQRLQLIFPPHVNNNFSLPSLVAVWVGAIKARNSANSSADIGLIIRCLSVAKVRLKVMLKQMCVYLIVGANYIII
jgi:hypothetical protein